LSTAKQCAKSGCVITLDSARALTAAAEHASDVISAATDDAIQAAAIMFDRMSAEIYEQTNHAA
jgi:2-C-methyl-D-erythritol 4-phosphate cytidylyltransferase